jgi:hypothetical protein
MRPLRQGRESCRTKHEKERRREQQIATKIVAGWNFHFVPVPGAGYDTAWETSLIDHYDGTPELPLLAR